MEDKNMEVKLKKFKVEEPNTVVNLLINACTSRDCRNKVVGVCFVGQDITKEKTVMDNFIRMQGDYKAIIQSVNPMIPPIFASDGNACCSEWNAVMEKLTGFARHETIVIHQKECIDEKEVEREELFIERELVYITQEMKNPLSGIRYTHKLLKGSAISDDQKKYLDTGDACERQILSIIDGAHLGSLEEGKIELKVEEFLLGDVVNAIVSQAMILLKEKKLHLIHEIPEPIKILRVYGDQMKLQSALSDFLLCIVDYAPSLNGWVEINISHGLKPIQDENEFVHLEFRMAHPGEGLPLPLINEMFAGRNNWTTPEGIALSISRKLLGVMNGSVHYIREQHRCYFQIELELRSKDPGLNGSGR